MECPLVLCPAGVLGTTQYYAPCSCVSLCDLSKCKYRKYGFIVKFQAVGATAGNAVAILGKKCGGSLPLVAASNNAVVTNASIVAGDTYTIIPSTVDGILRGVVQGI